MIHAFFMFLFYTTEYMTYITELAVDTSRLLQCCCNEGQKPVIPHPTGGHHACGCDRSLPDTHSFNSPAVKIVLQCARPIGEPLIFVCDCVLVLLPS